MKLFHTCDMCKRDTKAAELKKSEMTIYFRDHNYIDNPDIFYLPDISDIREMRDTGGDPVSDKPLYGYIFFTEVELSLKSVYIYVIWMHGEWFEIVHDFPPAYDIKMESVNLWKEVLHKDKSRLAKVEQLNIDIKQMSIEAEQFRNKIITLTTKAAKEFEDEGSLRAIMWNSGLAIENSNKVYLNLLGIQAGVIHEYIKERDKKDKINGVEK